MKVLGQSAYPVAFLIGSVVVLALGIGFRAYQAPRPLSESNLALQPAPQAHSPNELPQYVTDAAAKAARQLLYLDGAPHTAVMWDATHAITALDLTRPKAAVLLDAQATPVNLQPVTIPTGVPLDYWKVPAEVAVAPAPHASGTASGDWVIAVGRASKEHVVFAEGLFEGAASAHCGSFDYDQVSSSALLSSALFGGGLFTLSGDLLGIIVSCDGEPVVISADSVTQALRRPVFITDQLQSAYGMSANELKLEAVMVSAVWKGRPADLAGIRAGDQIIEADGQPIRLLSDLDVLEKGDDHSEHALTLRRERRNLTVSLSAHARPGTESAAASANGLSLVLDPMNARVIVASIVPASLWAKSGLQPGDVVVRVRGTPVRGLADAVHSLTAANRSPLNIEIERGNAKAEVRLTDE